MAFEALERILERMARTGYRSAMATTRGHIEQLPSGSFRVHVYAGTDP